MGTIALGFVVLNSSAATCVVNGYPVITLVPAAGSVHPVITHLGSAGAVTIAGQGSAGFVVEYGEEPVDGQTSCPKMTGVGVTLPFPGSIPVTVLAGFAPCGAPDVRVSAVLTTSQYEQLVA